MSIRISGVGWMVDLLLEESYATWYGIPRRLRIKGFTTEAEAAVYEAQVQEAVRDKQPLPDRAEKPVYRLWDCLEETYKRHYRETPAHQSRRCQVDLLKRRLPNVHIDQISTMMVDDLVETLRKEYKPNTVNNIISVLSKTLKSYERIGALDKAPQMRRLKPFHKALDVVTKAEEKRLLETLSPDVRAIIAMYLDTGCRKMELLRSRPKDLDLESRVLRVTGKTGPRAIPLTQRAWEICTHYAKGTPEDRRLFKVHDSTLMKAYKAGLKRAGITRNLTLHDLRHTFCTRLSEKGISPFVVQKLAGHSNIATTQRYTHLNVDALRQGIGALA